MFYRNIGKIKGIGNAPINNLPFNDIQSEEDFSIFFGGLNIALVRDIDRIHGLEGPLGLKIIVADQVIDRDLFPERREQYIQQVADSLRNDADAKVVLLDPDTGIEPGRATAKHVKVTEIQEMWEALSSGDWLVVYQHAFRDQKWREKSRIKFAQACGTQDIKTFQAKIASDVAFFAAKKE